MKKVLVCFFLISLAACSQESQPQGSGLPSTETLNQQQRERYQRTQKPAYISWGEVEDQLPRFELDCEDCPPSVGQMITTTVDGNQSKPSRITGNCFGTLVAPDLFLTSRHCLPVDLRRANRQCRHRMQVVFPRFQSSQSVEQVGCEKITELASSSISLDDSAIQPDWALIELDRALPQRFLEMDRAPIPDGTPLLAFVPLENPETQQISVQTITCTSRQKTMGVPEYNDDRSPVLLLDCDQDITKGFSGSALFMRTDQGLKPVAALSHIYDVQINQEDILVSPSIVATSFVCLPGQSDLPESCGFDPSRRQNLIDQLVAEALQEEKNNVKEQIQSIIGNESPLLWEDVTVEKIENGESSAHMQSLWQEVLNLERSLVGRDGKIAFFETAAPQAPTCLKADFIPDPVNAKQVFTKMPIVYLRLVYLPNQRVRIHSRVDALDVEVYEDPEQPGIYRTGVQQQPPAPPHRERALLSMGINFAATSFSVCP